MGEMVRGTLEGALLVVVWLALYTTVVGPAVGAVLPGFEEPMRLGPGDCVEGCSGTPNARGWLGLATTTVVILGYTLGMLWLTWDRRRPGPPADEP